MTIYIVQKVRSEYSGDIAINLTYTTNETEAQQIVDVLRSIERELAKAYHSTCQEPENPILKKIYQRTVTGKEITEHENEALGKEFQRQLDKAKEVYKKYGVEYTGSFQSFEFRYQELKNEINLDVAKVFEDF